MKPYCASCGSTRYLTHLGDCQDWKVPIIWPAPRPVLEPEVALEPEMAFAFLETQSSLELDQLLAHWVEEGKLQRAGVNADGRPLYRRISQDSA